MVYASGQMSCVQMSMATLGVSSRPSPGLNFASDSNACLCACMSRKGYLFLCPACLDSSLPVLTFVPHGSSLEWWLDRSLHLCGITCRKGCLVPTGKLSVCHSVLIIIRLSPKHAREGSFCVNLFPHFRWGVKVRLS